MTYKICQITVDKLSKTGNCYQQKLSKIVEECPKTERKITISWFKSCKNSENKSSQRNRKVSKNFRAAPHGRESNRKASENFRATDDGRLQSIQASQSYRDAKKAKQVELLVTSNVPG